jgi:hypothetical protein
MAIGGKLQVGEIFPVTSLYSKLIFTRFVLLEKRYRREVYVTSKAW